MVYQGMTALVQVVLYIGKCQGQNLQVKLGQGQLKIQGKWFTRV